MTKKEMFTSIVNGTITDEIKAMAANEIEKIDAANAKAAEKRAQKVAENQPIIDAALTKAVNGITASDLGAMYGCTTQKASYILRTLAAEGKLVASDVKVDKKPCKLYKLA